MALTLWVGLAMNISMLKCCSSNVYLNAAQVSAFRDLDSIKKIIPIIIVLIFIPLLGGCANIVRGTHESVTVETPECPKATCTLKHKKGEWLVTTPGSVIIPRSDDPLSITCNKDDKTVTQIVDSGVSSGAIVGDALLFGIFSAANASTDAHREYPDKVSVALICPPSELYSSEKNSSLVE